VDDCTSLHIGRLILTWFPNPPQQLMYPLAGGLLHAAMWPSDQSTYP
jgi:hypothetical protein